MSADFFFLSFFELVALDRCFGRVLRSSRCYYASAEKSVETSCARNGNIFNKALNNTIQSLCCCKFTTLPFFCLKKWGKTCLWCKKKFPLDTQPCSYFEGQKLCEYGNISQSYVGLMLYELLYTWKGSSHSLMPQCYVPVRSERTYLGNNYCKRSICPSCKVYLAEV